MDEQIKTIIDKYEPQRVDAMRKSGICMACGIMFSAIGFIVALILIFSLESNPTVAGFAIGLIVLGVAGLVIVLVGLSIRKKFKDALLFDMKKYIVDKYFPGYKYNHNAGMSEKEILTPGFFSKPDLFNSSDLFISSWKDIQFRKSRYTLSRREVHQTKEGTTVTYVPYAQGTMYFFDFERDFGSTVKIMEKGGGSWTQKGLKTVETEYIAFNKKFQVLTDDEKQVFYLLTPQIQEKILALEPLYKGQFYMAFVGSDLWVAINDSNQTMQFDIKKPLTEEGIQKFEFLYATPKLIIDNLGLSKDKFKANAGVK